MTNLRMIADHLGKPQIPSAGPPARWEEIRIDFSSLEALPRYPTMTILCLLALGGVVLALAAVSLVAFLMIVLH